MTKASKAYTSIDNLPKYNWDKVHETNDLVWLLVDAENKVPQKQLATTWDKIFDEFIDVFGVPEGMKEVLELKRDIAVWKYEMILGNDLSLQTFIDIAEYKLATLFKSEEKKEIDTTKPLIAKLIGSWPDYQKMSVKDYYQCIEALKQQHKSQISNNDGGE